MSTEQKTEVNILEVCEAELASAQAELKLIEERLESAKAASAEHIKAHNKSVKDLERAKRDVEDAISAVTNQGEPAPAGLKSKVLNIETQIVQAKAEHEKSGQRLEIIRAIEQAEKEHQAATASVASWTAKTEIAKYLATKSTDAGGSYGALSAPCFKTLDDARAKYLAEVPIVLSVEADGRISAVNYWTWIEAAACATVPLATEKNFIVQEIPRSMRWLKEVKKYASLRSEGDGDLVQSDGVYLVRVDPEYATAEPNAVPVAQPDVEGDSEGDEEPDKQPMIAEWDDRLVKHQPSLFKRRYFFVEETRDFYAIWPKDFPDVEVKYSIRANYGAPETKFVSGFGKTGTYDASGLFSDFKNVLRKVDGIFPVTLHKRAEQGIAKFATTTPVFEARVNRLTLDLIEKEVGMYWEAFITSPWSEAIDSPPLIMLKHLCKRAIETPDVWTLDHRGHYGFRLRTRDHSWIVGQIYCPPAALSRETAISHEEVIYTPGSSHGSRVVVGDAIIYVEGFVRDSR